MQVHHHKLSTGTVSFKFTLTSPTCPSHVIFFSQRKKDHVRELFESRARAEEEALGARTPRNRLHVSSLVALLEERQRDDRVVARQQLAEKYGMDVERLEKLVRCVNVPSVREPLDGAAVGYIRDSESGEDVVVKEVSFLFVWRGVVHLLGLMLVCIGGVEGANVSVVV